MRGVLIVLAISAIITLMFPVDKETPEEQPCEQNPTCLSVAGEVAAPVADGTEILGRKIARKIIN